MHAGNIRTFPRGNIISSSRESRRSPILWAVQVVEQFSDFSGQSFAEEEREKLKYTLASTKTGG